ncbi:MAG: methionyl-tRNA formyltransferase [Candidatus Acidiferrales bacterium]
MPLRIVYCGTPAFALPALRHLIAQPDFQIEGVVTQPDRPRGRGNLVSSSRVKDAALEAGIAVYQPERIKSESARDYFKRAAPDVVVIVAYGQIIPAALLEIPRLGWVNLHASLLPKYRGAAPVNWAIVNGETRTGVTIMQVEAGLDTGPILMRHETEIGPDETAPQLAARLAETGAPLVAETLRKLAGGELTLSPQDGSQASFAPLLKKDDGRINWSEPAEKIYDRIRGLDPWPGAFTFFREHTCAVWGRPGASLDPSARPGVLAIFDGDVFVACGDGTALRLDRVQLEGRKRVTALEFANGARFAPGERFAAAM